MKPITDTINKIKISSGVIRALVFAAASKDIRYYLNGVFFSPRKGHAVATDGHMLIVIKLPEIIDSDDVIIPIDVCKLATKKVEDVYVNFDKNTITCKTYELGFKPIDGRFPDYSKVIPSLDDLGEANKCFHRINPQHLMDINKAISAYCGAKTDSYNLYFHEGKTVYVCPFGTNFLCVFCPIRNEDKPSSLDVRDYVWLTGKNDEQGNGNCGDKKKLSAGGV